MLCHNKFSDLHLLKLESLLSLSSHANDPSIEHHLICGQAKQYGLTLPHSLSTLKAMFD